MKILRVSLKNLNSLRGEHEIDLEKEPLASAGIFAITGPTGAGKSTLLDAITLALFGRAARYDKTPNPEDMMSRHTGECSAQVLFEVAQGRFTAAWHLNRARGKTDGKIQPPKRFIYDAAGATLAQNVTQADEKIVEICGLDYERFLRSVLLAQGEFARFLKAKADERSELLEQLTGTDIHSHLSILAHEEKAKREKDFELREQALGSIALLTEEERTARTEGIASIAASISQQQQARRTLGQSIEQGRALADCIGKSAKLAAEQQQLHAQRQAQLGNFEALARHRQTEPFVADLARIGQFTTQLERARQQSQSAIQNAAKARQDLVLQLDAALFLAKRQREVAGARLQQVHDERSKAEKAFMGLNDWLAANAADKALITELPAISTALAWLVRRRDETDAAVRQAADLDAKLGKARTTLQTRQGEHANAAKFQTQLSGKLHEAQQQLSALLKDRSVADLDHEAAQANREHQRLSEVASVLEQCEQTITRGQGLVKDIAEAEKLLQAHRVARADLAEREQQAADLMSALQESLHKTQLIASLEDHRAHLVDGVECPLCGALEHPFSKAEFAPVNKLEEQLAQARTNHRASQNATAQKDVEIAKTEQSLHNLQQQLANERSSLKTLRARLPQPVASHAETLQLVADFQQRAETLAQELKQARAFELLVHKAETESLQQQGVVDSAAQRVQTLANDLQTQQQDLERNAERQQLARTEVDDASQKLALLIAPFHLAVPEVGADKQLAALLIERRNAFSRNEQQLAEVQQKMQVLTTEAEKIQLEADDIDRQSHEFTLAAQADDLAKVSHDAHEAQSLSKVWHNLEQAAAAIQQAGNDLTAAVATAAEREQAVNLASSALSDGARELTVKLASSGFETIEAIRAARLADEEAARVARLEKTIEEKEQALVGQLALMRANEAELRQNKPPEGDALAAAGQQHATIEVELNELQKRGTLLTADLERDDQNREKQASGREQIEAERQQLAVWRLLADLIGSADGKKFRVFAQGLSLDLLIRHANQHLQRLAERYRLRRKQGEALELEIIDLHQASASRPMASLSGGESFLASLALALGLSDLAGRNVRIDSLFIDEGFGSLDGDTLDVAVAALEGLRMNQKTVGIISHVDLLKERLTTQVQVERGPGGVSRITVKA